MKMSFIEPRLEKVLNNYNKKVQSTSNEKQIQLAKVDIDEFGELSAKFGVEAVPTGFSNSMRK